MTQVYDFAQSHDAEELVRAVYDSALHGEQQVWERIYKWCTERLLQPVQTVGHASFGLAMPVFLLAMMRGCLPESNGAGTGAQFLLRLMLLLGFSEIAGIALTAVEECLKSVRNFTDTVSPGITAILSAMGMNGTAALVSPAAALAGGIAENVFHKYGLPLCKIALCTSMAGNFSTAIELGRFTDLLKKTANWGAGLATTLFTALIALQGSIAEAADSVGMRTAKFAVDSAGSVIGNGVSDAWDGFISGLLVTKNALGMSGITALLAAGFRPIVYSLAAMLSLNLIAALLDLFGEKETARAAVQIGEICQMALSLATGAMTIAAVLLGAAMSAGRYFLS